MHEPPVARRRRQARGHQLGGPRAEDVLLGRAAQDGEPLRRLAGRGAERLRAGR